MKFKSSLVIAFLIFCVTGVKAGDSLVGGINFRQITLPQAIAAAKKEKKFVFMHGMADWCSHCKTMAETVYQDKEVADFYNSNYVCIKVDMEKEGKDIAKKLKITSYPGLIYFDSTGMVVHRAKGERKKPDFMELGRNAIDPQKNLKYYENTFNAGKATREEAYIYIRLLEMGGVDSQAKLNNYLMKLSVEQLQTPEYWRFISDFLKDHTLKIMDVLVSNKKGFEEKFTSDSVNNKITGIYISEMMKKVQRLDTIGYYQLKMGLMNSKLDIREKICAYADLTTFKIKAEWPKYIAAAPAFIEKYCNNDAKKLNEAAQQFAERATEQSDLLMAEQWAKRSIELYDVYKFNMTLTSLQVKLQKKQESLVSAKHTLELGQKANQDVKPLLLLIEKIEGMQ